ncbi:MAG TPA: nuclear transport factor 2 family protein [Rhizorhapis sp.]|nr:nuclear transport factor 2 family protein [Rhizorhapis sp.]
MSAKDVIRLYLDAKDRESREALLDDSLSWTVIGKGPMYRTYHGKAGFLDELMGQIGARLVPGSHQVTVRAIYEDAAAQTVIAELAETAIAAGGGTYANEVAAIFRVSNGKIVEAREYMDLRPVDRLMSDPPL